MTKPVIKWLITLSLCLLNPEAIAEDRSSIDLIIKGDYIVTMNDADQIIRHGAVAVESGTIVAVGPFVDIDRRYRAKETLSGEERLVMPGLINGHSHAAMTLLRGIADDLSLNEWLNDYIFPAERMFVDPEFVRLGTELACWEMVRGGTTTFVDMYYHSETIAQ
ncbi:MAG: amidohydrolase family protein, partial [Pseudomonadales bacterium]|nr:amidohydrolase family protein [Pseudomonadales bacterium]